MKRRECRLTASFMATVLLITMQPVALAQGTRIQAPKNKYTVEQDVELGRQAAGEYEKIFPTLSENSAADSYVESLGRRLVAAIPKEYQNPAFRFEFDVINARDLNASALPGGPMYVNRGMIQAAANEGELAGVMAHEISHVVLRHGTARASQGQSPKYQLPAIGGAILGAIIGGNLGGIIAQGTQAGIGIYLLKYSRDYERQADVLGSQIMARAGYDPLDMAGMFQTIQKEGGGSSMVEWLSSHPDPGKRAERIQQEATKLRVNRAAARHDTEEFEQVKAALGRMAPAPTMQQLYENYAATQQSGGSSPYPTGSRVEQRVERPASTYRSYTGGNLFTVSVPGNWEQFESQNSVTFAPRGAYGDYQGQSVFTHGMIIGLVNPGTTNLEDASDRFNGSLLQSNSYLQPQGRYQRTAIDRRSALGLVLAGRSPVTGQTEIVRVYTAMIQNGLLFYVIQVVPQNESGSYNRAFSNTLRSIRING